MNTLSWSPPTAFADKLGPGAGRGEDPADALGIASKGAKGHVPVLGRQNHLFDRAHFAGRELAWARARTRRSVRELAGVLRSSPDVVPSRFQPEDAQNDGQGKDVFGAGDCAKDAGLGLAFWETISVEAETGSTKESQQEADNSGEKPRPPFPMCPGIERTLQVLTERLRGNNLAKAAPSPGRHGGTWNLDVPGQVLAPQRTTCSRNRWS